MNLGDRMKAYEDSWKIYFPPRMPIILRIDGRAFHTFTKGFKKPFDREISDAMYGSLCTLMKAAQGACIGYTQSDEASIFLHTYNKFDTDAWFGGCKQKIESIAASIFTARFNYYFSGDEDDNLDYANFDCRAFVLPKEEVYNYFLWRYRDCKRNAILSFARHEFGHNECQNKNTTQLLDMIGDKWEDVADEFKNGILKFEDKHTVQPCPNIEGEIFEIVYKQEET